MSVFDVPAKELIDLIAEDFKEKMKSPGFADYAKTGQNRERSPDNPDWWYIRTASILRRVMMDGPVGTQSLRTYYGGKKNRGVKPNRFRKASGKVIRTCLQALETEKLIKKYKKEGRSITPEGQKYLDAKSKELKGKLEGIKKDQILKRIETQKLRIEKDKTAKKARDARADIFKTHKAAASKDQSQRDKEKKLQKKGNKGKKGKGTKGGKKKGKKK